MACAVDFRDGAIEDPCVYDRSQAGAMEQNEEGKGEREGHGDGKEEVGVQTEQPEGEQKGKQGERRRKKREEKVPPVTLFIPEFHLCAFLVQSGLQIQA
ncbi:hypothetical protein STEG23_004139 [Scotinomys teguina]